MTQSPVAERLGFLLRRAQQAHVALWQRIVSTEVTSVQFGAMTILDAEPGLSQVELGRRLDLDRSTIADLVQRLERRALVRRSPHSSDGRRKALEVTAVGATIVRDLAPRVEQMDDLLTEALAVGERAALREALLAVVGSVERASTT